MPEYRRRLPHFDPADAYLFLTWRLSGSMPAKPQPNTEPGRAVAVIMTGIGDDGARGMLEMKEAGAATIAQDEATSVIFGMPHEAIKRGAVDSILPQQSIAASILNRAR